jgi:hypothetical protein
VERDAVLQARARLKLDLFRGREAIEDLEPLLAGTRAAGNRAREVELLLMRSRAHYILSLDQPGYAEQTRASYAEAYALAKEIGDKRAMCQALIPTAWFIDYWQEYRDQAIANNDEARTLAAELGDEELEIEAASSRLRLVSWAEGHEDAMGIRERLEARRDPLRLKEHLFWLMWHYWLRADFEECVATCNDGIALSAQLASPPVQYASIKGLALTDLGRFDEAWASFQEEVADERHPFGRCMRDLGTAIWLEAVGTLDRAEATARAVREEAGRLSRTWMQRAMLDLLTIIGARRGLEHPELADALEQKEGQIELQIVPVAAAAAALARGNFAEALALADQSAESSLRLGARRARIIALELAIRALAGLGRWDELLTRADTALAETEATGFRTRTWRILAARAQARDASGDAAGASADRSAARALLADMAGRIADPEIRAAFEADSKTFMNLQSTHTG